MDACVTDITEHLGPKGGEQWVPMGAQDSHYCQSQVVLSACLSCAVFFQYELALAGTCRLVLHPNCFT